MGIVSSWLRALIGASGVTLLVPVGLLAAVLVAATVGGSGLGSVGQLIGGPEVPGVSAQAPGAGGSLPTVPARRGERGASTTTTRTSAAQRTAARRRAAQRRRQGSGGSSQTTQESTKGPTTTAGTPPPPPQPVTGATPPPPPPPPPTPERNPVRRIGNAVKDLVRPLPIVGPPVADAVGTVIDLVAPPGGRNAVSKTVGKVLGAK